MNPQTFLTLDENAHFYSLMPIKTLTIKGKTHEGGYKFKD
jgi:hypothetical protein